MIMDDVYPAFSRQSNGRIGNQFCLRRLLFIGVVYLVQSSGLITKAGTLLPPGQTGSLLEVTNGNVRLEYNLSTGRANFYWQNSMKISGFYAGVELASYITDTIYTNHTWTVASNEVAVTSTTSNLPAMTQTFIFDQNDSFLASVSMSASTNLQSNWMGPVIVDSYGFLNIGITNENRTLFVPFDNDDFVSYNSEPMNSSDVGNEVAAFYDNVSRNGLVVGSVTHDTWKTGIYWSGSNNEINQMNVFGGVTNFWTWDVMPHGSVIGKTISSPVVFVGFNTDWRTEMENFANENLLYAPRLGWTNGVPFGWNSWGVTNYQENISYNAAIAVSDSIHTNLQPYGFTNNGTVYVNLDSAWSNLSSSQLQDFVNHCHANGQKAGVYWTPFVYWGTLTQSTNQGVPGSSYTYGQILLRTSSGAGISYDSGYAIDPTHPGTRQLIQYQINQFTNYGFDYLKLDFLSHGSLEGVHYDPDVTTGIEAFNEGMKYLLSQINGTMFISESIAPLFPYQYGHSRRIACDAYTSFISNTAYTMNGVSCGWWIGGRLYQFNDPDDLVFDNGPSTNENQSRLINGVVTGLYLNGSILTNAASVARAQLCLTNAAINAVVRAGQTFRPVDGATGTGAGNMFVQQNGKTWCIAVFNYNSSATNETVNLSSAGLPAKTFVATNLWDGTSVMVTNMMSVSLNAAQSKLFQLSLTTDPPPPGFSVTTPVGGNQVVLNGTNGIPGWNCYVAASTDISLPTAQWQVIATNTFDVNGNVCITNVIGAIPWQFYLLRM
jgi:alpha-galactosidase